jgi:hypothetical protein
VQTKRIAASGCVEIGRTGGGPNCAGVFLYAYWAGLSGRGRQHCDEQLLQGLIHVIAAAGMGFEQMHGKALVSVKHTFHPLVLGYAKYVACCCIFLSQQWGAL